MSDVSHLYGGDLTVAAGGDLATVGATVLGQQRVLRRLLTNPGDYLWNPSYGAGLGQFVGQTANIGRIRSVIRGQIFQEATVARTPEPTIEITIETGGAITVAIAYADAVNQTTQTLTFTVGAV